ncbi:MAG TPA: RluA family pseudouridine synthase [Kofleriaceae bacterium]
MTPPDRFPSPFAVPPHPLAVAAALDLSRDLARDFAWLDAPGMGKMFGVLVCAAPDGREVVLRGFSGMLTPGTDDGWLVPGFVPPLFAAAARAAIWPAGQRALRSYELALRALDEDPARLAAVSALAAARASHASALDALRARHRDRRAARHAARAALDAPAAAHADVAHALDAPAAAHAAPAAAHAALDAPAAAHPALDAPAAAHDAPAAALAAAAHALDAAHAAAATAAAAAHPALDAPAAAHALDQQSRADTAERRAFDAAHDASLAALAARVADFDAERARLERLRADESRRLMTLVHDSYLLRSFSGELADLRSLFAPSEPPGGAGDCAGPKLLGHAYRLGLRPLALAEFWFGAPAGGRVPGAFYPSCRGKCGPILPFLLRGLAHAPPPLFASRSSAPLRTLYEDAHLLAIDKPIDLLSVPGRGSAHKDSVSTRLPGVTVVHRLDLDVSGVLLCAKDAATHALLQRAFASRAVDKRYVAILAGPVAPDLGEINLPLRVDLDDRPRQLVDPLHGKPALTAYRVLSRDASRTRVSLSPLTGRTHQLRVHCAAALSPIVGDRLYGTPADRLLLHAESLAFTHPHTGARITIESPAPF